MRDRIISSQLTTYSFAATAPHFYRYVNCVPAALHLYVLQLALEETVVEGSAHVKPAALHFCRGFATQQVELRLANSFCSQAYLAQLRGGAERAQC